MFASTRTKACKNCGKAGHAAFTCKPRKPLKPAKPLNHTGKVGKNWKSARKLWFKRHTAETFNCHYCKKQLKRSEVTLDHFLSRSRHPELRNELKNLVVACWICNTEKGSLSGDEYIERLKDVHAEE